MKGNIFIDSNIFLYAFMESKLPQKEITTNIIAKEKVSTVLKVIPDSLITNLLITKHLHKCVSNYK